MKESINIEHDRLVALLSTYDVIALDYQRDIITTNSLHLKGLKNDLRYYLMDWEIILSNVSLGFADTNLETASEILQILLDDYTMIGHGNGNYHKPPEAKLVEKNGNFYWYINFTTTVRKYI
jgi:hypothetical protein